MTAPDRDAHRSYEERHREIDTETRARFRQLAEVLDLPPEIRPAFIAAGLRAARFHAAESALADHELRSGHSWPAEDRQVRDDLRERQWETALHAVREVMPDLDQRSQPPSQPATMEEEKPRRRGGYQPISTISRPPEP